MPDTSTEVAIATTTLGSASSTITFSSIPQTYTDLRLILTCTITPSGNIQVQFNNDTGTNYSKTVLYGNGTSAGTYNSVSATSIVYNSNNTSATIPFMSDINIFSYTGSTNKTCLLSLFGDFNGSGSQANNVGLWRSTSAISTITLSPTGGAQFGSGSTATLYGIL